MATRIGCDNLVYALLTADDGTTEKLFSMMMVQESQLQL
jgi:hypothetical protein